MGAACSARWAAIRRASSAPIGAPSSANTRTVSFFVVPRQHSGQPRVPLRATPQWAVRTRWLGRQEPWSVPSPTQATYPSGRINTAVGSGDRAEHRKLPHTGILGVDPLDPIRPWSDVEAPGSPRLSSTGRASCSRVNTRSGPLGGDQVEIGHAAPEQRVSRAEVVVNVQTRHHRGVCACEARPCSAARTWSRARLRPFVAAAERRLRHGVLEHAGSRSGAARHGRYRAGSPAMCRLTTWASFHPRFTASWTPMLSPCPPAGECTCAASPARSTRLSR